MGVYIKGMEMPTSCAACRIGHRDIGWDNTDNEHEIVFCPIIQQGSLIADATVKRHQLCPLVPVPEHGDLIDRSHLCYDSIGGDYGSGTRVYYAYEVEHAPVIIPAEEGE